MKVSKKKQKSFVKTRKGYIKRSRKLNLDRNTTRDQYTELIAEYREVQLEIQAYSIDSEMAMKKITKEDEWDNIMNEILESNSKNKTRQKMEKGSQKLYDKVVMACEKNIGDDLIREKVLESVNKFKQKVDGFIPKISELSYKNSESIRDYSAERVDYEEIINEIREMRREIMNAFLDTRFQLLEYTTEEQWSKIIKHFDKLVKKDKIT